MAQLPGSSLQVLDARAAGSESALRGTTDEVKWRIAAMISAVVLMALLIWFTRRPLWRS